MDSSIAEIIIGDSLNLKRDSDTGLKNIIKSNSTLQKRLVGWKLSLLIITCLDHILCDVRFLTNKLRTTNPKLLFFSFLLFIFSRKGV